MSHRTLKKIAILTSGGDAPGMNACIRAITRTALYHDLEVVGFRNGYWGLLKSNSVPLHSTSVSYILQRGGTILRSGRCRDFREAEARQRAVKHLEELAIDALFVIGGDGSFRGLHELGKIWSGQTLGLPGTIDNDLYGTDWTIGYFTALDTALAAIDNIRDTADAFERIFVIEVMGRHSGFLALGVGVSSGAEDILIPEEPFEVESVVDRLVEAKRIGKASYIIILAEGAYSGGAVELAAQLRERTQYDCRPSVLGYIQRGGSPTAHDRLLASRLGAHAVESALKGETGVMSGMIKGELRLTPLEKTWTETKPIDPYLLRINEKLAT